MQIKILTGQLSKAKQLTNELTKTTTYQPSSIECLDIVGIQLQCRITSISCSPVLAKLQVADGKVEVAGKQQAMSRFTCFTLARQILNYPFVLSPSKVVLVRLQEKARQRDQIIITVCSTAWSLQYSQTRSPAVSQTADHIVLQFWHVESMEVEGC